jgi:hypothetical protein
MDWCATGDFHKANHAPIAVLNGDRAKAVLRLKAQAGDRISLSAQGSTDPDGHAIVPTWFVYREAGSLPQEVKLSADRGGTTTLVAPPAERQGTVHVILQLEDNGEPRLCAYRRAVIAVEP